MSTTTETWEQSKARELSDRKERVMQLRGVALQITKAMPGGKWIFFPWEDDDFFWGDHIGKMQHPTGRYTIDLSINKGDGKWIVSGNNQNGWDSWHASQIRPSAIGMSIQKSPEKIAADICRRYLDAWEKYVDMQVEYAARVNDNANKRKAAIADILSSTDCGLKTHNKTSPGSEYLYLPGDQGKPYGDLKPSHDGTDWDIKLDNLTAAQVKAILKIVTK